MMDDDSSGTGEDDGDGDVGGHGVGDVGGYGVADECFNYISCRQIIKSTRCG